MVSALIFSTISPGLGDFVIFANAQEITKQETMRQEEMKQETTKAIIQEQNVSLPSVSEKLKSTKSKINLPDSKQLNGLLNKKKNYVDGEIIVKYKNNKINLDTSAGRTKALSFNKSKFLEKKEDLRKNNISVLKIKDTKTVEDKIAELKKDTNVEYVEPNYIRPWSSIFPNDNNFSLQWALNNAIAPTADISAIDVWNITTGSSAVVIGVLDSGIAYNHPDLKNNMWDGSLGCKDESNQNIFCPNHGWDYINNSNNPLDDNGHGTHVAGIIGAEGNNGIGITGVNWNVKLMALKVGNSDGAIVGDVVKAIDFAIYNGVKIINASFTGDLFSQTEYNAIKRFKDAGGIFVAAAGNGSYYGDLSIGDNHDSQISLYPSDYDLDNIISVAATDQNDDLASFSDYGATSVDVGAPGINIYSTIVADSNILFETFEGLTTSSIPGDWNRNGIENSWGTYNRTDLFGIGWGKVLYGDLNYPYLSNANTTVTSPLYNLSNSAKSNINFWTRCDTSYHLNSEGSIFQDYMALEISMDGENFVELKKWNEFSIDIENQDSEDSTGWATKYYSLSIPDNYLTNNFKFRLRWVTDGVDNNYDGCLVDDINLTKFSDGSDMQYGYMDGTSMAASHVAGLVALIWGYKPDLNYAQVKNTILTTGDDVSSLHGKTSAGTRINAFNALNSLVPATHSISGIVKYYDGVKVVPNAIVKLETDLGVLVAITTTDSNGFYKFIEVSKGANYIIKVDKDDAYSTKGVNVLDLIILKKHLIKLEILTNIYKLIAADVDNLNFVNLVDLVKLKKYTLKIENLPSSSWKFYRSDANLTTANYLTAGLTRDINNLNSDVIDQNFVGIKKGDVDSSWTN